LFESLLKDIKKSLSKSSSAELKNLYTEAMGEYIIQHRLEAHQLYIKALEMGRELLEFDEDNKIKNPNSIRGVSNTLLNLGAFEQSEKYLKRLIPLYSGNSAQVGDTKAHLAYCFLRQGKLDKAERLIEGAIEEIKKNTAGKERKFIAVWLSYALLVKSLVLNARGDISEALEVAKEALQLSKKEDRKFRLKQAQELVDYLKKK
jgi:tetratricopeptide (TPR) repeat protein